MKNDRHRKMPERLLEDPDARASMCINDISKLFMHTVRRRCEQRGIPHGYHKLLMELAHSDGVTQLSLVKLTHLTAPTVSVALTKMEADGLVRREADGKDMRRMKVFLTDKGRQQDEYVRSVFGELDNELTKGISEEELAAVMPVLKKMLKNMLEVDAE